MLSQVEKLMMGVIIVVLPTALVCHRRHYQRQQQQQSSYNSPLTAYFNQSDGYNLLWSKSANSRHQLKAERDGDNHVIKGDVILGDRSTPVMAYAANRNNSVSLIHWVKELNLSPNKAMKLSFYKDNAIKPALKYLFAAKNLLKIPIILHADLEYGPNGKIASTQPVDPKAFLHYIALYCPSAFVSVSWLTDLPEKDELIPINYSWRDLLDMLEYTYESRQQIIYNFRALYIDEFVDQIMWLLGISPSYSVSIVSADYPLDKVADWLPLVRLRKFAPPSRVYYDLQPQNEREIFQLEIKDLEWGAMMKPTRFHRADWRVVQFLNPDALLSTIITSDRGLAFVGWPTAFLVSERSATTGQGQTVSGTVLFVPKRHWMENPTEPITGLSFFLLNRIDDITSPLLRDGIHLFIGFDGTIAIQNRQKHKGLYRSSGFYSQSYAKVARHDCYAFNIVMELTSVSLTIYPSRDCTGANETLPTIGVYRQISLSLPLQASQPAFVLAQKSGDANMDLIVENLQHHSGSGVVGVSLALLLIVMLFSFNTFELSHSL